MMRQPTDYTPMDIGADCAACGRNDFLPIKCGKCTQNFCSEHGRLHPCSSATGEVYMPRAPRNPCRNKQKCYTERCNTRLTLTNCMTCEHCGNKICIPCRFSHSTTCEVYLAKLDGEKKNEEAKVFDDNVRYHRLEVQQRLLALCTQENAAGQADARAIVDSMLQMITEINPGDMNVVKREKLLKTDGTMLETLIN